MKWDEGGRWFTIFHVLHTFHLNVPNSKAQLVAFDSYPTSDNSSWLHNPDAIVDDQGCYVDQFAYVPTV